MDNIERVISLAEDGDRDGLAHLIESDSTLLRSTDEHGWTVLHRAAHFGHTQTVEMLLGLGADPNAKDLKRSTPLHDAAMGWSDHFPVMELLVRARSDVNLRNTYWQTPIMVSVQSSNLTGFAYLLGRGARLDLRDRQRLDLLGMAQSQLDSVPKDRKFARQREDLRAIIAALDSIGEAHASG